MAVSEFALDRGIAPSKAIGRGEWLIALTYALALLWINAYICRDLVHNPVAAMNSMHGFWIALAKHAGNSWFRSNWWPYWDGGMPYEFTYAPLVPGLMAAGKALTGTSYILAFQTITAVVYCLGPLTLFAMAWLWMRAPGAAFAGALFYSLTAPTQLIVPDDAFSWIRFWDARRLYITGLWDDTPHLAALALLPIAILLLVASLQRRRFRYYIPTIVAIALMGLASEFGVVEMLMAAVCLLFALRREPLWRNIATTVTLGAVAYAIILPFLPPSLLFAIGNASKSDAGSAINLGSITALAIVVLGWTILAQLLPRWTTDCRLEFLTYFAYLTASVPILAQYLHRQFLPQPGRYKIEMEFALALLLPFAIRPIFVRARMPVKAAVAFLLLALAGEQIASHRRYAKAIITSQDLAQTIEYRTSVRAQSIGTRVMLPGSIGQWANAFSDVRQFSGSSWSKAMNPVQQLGLAVVYNGGATQEQDARTSLAWMKAFGVGAIAVAGPKSHEFWKPYAHPSKFEGVLPVLWREDDVTIYQIAQRTSSLAHVVPASALATRAPGNPSDISAFDNYVSALDDPTLPLAEMEWQGSNRIRLKTTAEPGQAISLQVSYHPGWHARVSGRVIQLHRDGLGLMWFNPDCHGTCEVQLDYDGGWELRLSRFISYTAIAILLICMLSIVFHIRLVERLRS